MWQKILLISIGGTLGTLSRYGLSTLVQRYAGAGFPWGTVTVNVLGSFAFGLVWQLTEQRLGLSAETRLLVLTGFLGAFTTFSTFMFETGELMRNSHYALAAGNLLLQCSVGIVFLFLGLMLGRQF